MCGRGAALAAPHLPGGICFILHPPLSTYIGSKMYRTNGKGQKEECLTFNIFSLFSIPHIAKKRYFAEEYYMLKVSLLSAVFSKL